jgi:DNA-binding NarL/FixJ family response regulator
VEVEGSPTTVVVADDHAAVRTFVRETLEAGGFVVVAEAADAHAAVEAVREHRPQVALLDIHMPGSGIAAAAEITARIPGVAVVMLTVSRTNEDLFEALRAGASGYLLKDIDPSRLPNALQAVLRGEAALPRALVTRVIDEFRQREEGKNRTRSLPQNARLSSREWEVADGLAAGLTTNEIADRLFIGGNTVRSHVASILRKLRVSSREEAVELLREEEER